MPIADVPDKARALYEARRNRVPIPPFTDADPTLGMADGYAVQAEVTRLILADGDTVVGYKAGLTSEAMQTMLGVGQPDYGPVLGSTVYRDGDEVSLGRFIQPKIEAEIVFVMGAALRGPGATVDDARATVGEMAASMEIVDSRFEDWRIKLCDTVADLASNGAVALSDTRVPLGDTDVRTIAMTLLRDGTQIDQGTGAAALGDPLAVVAWLANTLAADGIGLEPGHLIMTGALHAAVPMAAGETYRADFDILGPVSVRVVP